jgi:O-antigen/teichoic acid export membrane protein
VHPRKFVRDSLGVALSSAVARVALLARGVVAAAALGPLGYGGWNALNLILDYGSYATCGALQGLDLELPAAVAGTPPAGGPDRARLLLAGAWGIVVTGGLLFSLVVIAALASGRPRMARSLGLLPPLLMLAAALLQLAIQYHVSALKARGEFGTVSRATAAQVLIGGAAGIALVWRFGIEGLLWGWLAGTVVALALLRLKAPIPLIPAHPAVGVALVRAGFPVFAFFAASLVLRSVDRLALLHYGNATGLGHYSLGLMAAGLVLYLPESAASVLYPRIAAAARTRPDAHAPRPGPGDAPSAWARVQLDVTRAQGALTVAMPLVVALGMIWAAPVVATFLPAFREAVPALHLLAVGALMLAASTIPGYFLLGSGHAPRLLVFGVAAAAFSATLVFGVAARAPEPTPVAFASATGYAVFGLGLVVLSTRELFAPGAGRRRFLAASFVPALWASALALTACRIGPAESWLAALARSAAVAVGYLPILWWFGRGVGLKRLAREWLLARLVPV